MPALWGEGESSGTSQVASLGVQKGPSRRQALPPSTQEGKWVVDTGLAESEQLSACHISSSRQPEAQVLLSPHFADEEAQAEEMVPQIPHFRRVRRAAARPLGGASSH